MKIKKNQAASSLLSIAVRSTFLFPHAPVENHACISYRKAYKPKQNMLRDGFFTKCFYIFLFKTYQM